MGRAKRQLAMSCRACEAMFPLQASALTHPGHFAKII